MKFKDKIEIKLEEKSNSKATYLRGTDSFRIIIKKDQNTIHQCLDLIHELAHVVNMINYFSKGILLSDKGAYLSEKEATEIEMEVLMSISEDLYRAYFSDFLFNLGGLCLKLNCTKN